MTASRWDWLTAFIERRRQAQYIRPLALAPPILALLLLLPMLRPLRHPAGTDISGDEAARLATVSQLAEKGMLALPSRPPANANWPIVTRDGRTYADQPPVLAVLMAAAYQPMRRAGLSFDASPILAPYLLTVLFSAIPVAAIGGIVYRLGRLLELPRRHRAALGVLVVVAGGVLPYGAVINPYAPAAALLLAATAALAHLAVSAKPPRDGAWVVLAGLLASLAGVIEPRSAAPTAVLLAGTLLFMRWPLGLRIGGLGLFALGAAPPLILHLVLAFDRPPPPPPVVPAPSTVPAMVAPTTEPGIDDLPEVAGPTYSVAIATGRVAWVAGGPHGVLSHTPLVLFGLVGAWGVLRRHWPGPVKALAGAAVLAGGWVLLDWCLRGSSVPPGREVMFGPQPVVALLPLLCFWSAEGLRPTPAGRHRIVRTLFMLAVVASAATALAGLAWPYPRGGFDGYTPVDALRAAFKLP